MKFVERFGKLSIDAQFSPTQLITMLTLSASETDKFGKMVDVDHFKIGKELTAAKNEVPRGQWQTWLNDNFQLSYKMAAKFMQLANRFSNVSTSRLFNQSQLLEMLALPAGEEEKFIEEHAAADLLSQ